MAIDSLTKLESLQIVELCQQYPKCCLVAQIYVDAFRQTLLTLQDVKCCIELQAKSTKSFYARVNIQHFSEMLVAYQVPISTKIA